MARYRPELISTDVSSGIVYQAFGDVPTLARDEAVEMASQLSELVPNKTISSRVKVKRDDRREPGQRFIAQGNLDVSGTMIRAEAAADTAAGAIHALADRLEAKLTHMGERRRQAKTRPPSQKPRSAWAGKDPRNRIAYASRPPEERSLVRRKTYPSRDHSTVNEALTALDLRDYKFFIFTDEADGQTTVVSEQGDERELRKVDGSEPGEGTIHPSIRVNDGEAPSLAVTEAVSRLNATGEAFLLFTDATRGGGCVLYRRYDGHYGLLVPQTSNV